MGMPAGAGAGGVDPSKASEYSEQDVMNVLAMIRKEFNIDDHRIYVMGHSQGGAGALHIADKYSSIWAGVAGLAPGAPGFQLDANARFKDVPILIMVGEKDGLIGSVQRLDERMKSLNIPHEYREVPGKDHGSIIMGGMSNVFLFFGQHTRP
jgi:predicted peptidase